MSRSRDISNQEFNWLTAIEPLEQRARDGSVVWKCKCRCGKILYEKCHDLTCYKISSCGCKPHSRLSASKLWAGYKDISGTFFSNLKYGAIKRGLEFSITIESLWELYLKQDCKCKLSGLPISFISGISTSEHKQTASVDRINNSEGYTNSNIHYYINV